MRLNLQGRRWSCGSTSLRMIATAVALLGALGASSLYAQVGQEALISGFESTRSVVPQRQPRPQGGPEGIDAMFEASDIDADVEVIVGYSKLITLKKEIAGEGVQPVIAIGDPVVVSFQVINSRTIRLVGQTVGETDLSILTSENKTYVLRVRVIYDLEVLRARLKETYPDASLTIVQMRQHLIVKGEARDLIQVQQILTTIQSFLESMFAAQQGSSSGQSGGGGQQPGGPQGQPQPGPIDPGDDPQAGGPDGQPDAVTPGQGGAQSVTGTVPAGTIINLIRVPGSQQVLLKCRIAELSRNASRRMGFNFNWGNANFLANVNSTAIGQINGAVVASSQFDFVLNALRSNRLARILAEPNLVTMSGHQASFLVGGEVPIPVPQGTGGGTTITIEYREFGTRLNFTPFVLDRDVIRLTVTPEVSAIDANLSVAIVAGADPVPGFVTRRTSTTVEMKQGQTLAISGLMQMQAAGQTDRLAGPGDLPYVGMLFRDNTQDRTETETVVTVTPYLTEAMNPNQVPKMPGDTIKEPNDLEFYLLGRTEGRTGRDFRSTTEWDDPVGLRRIMNLEKRRVQGAHGFSE